MENFLDIKLANTTEIAKIAQIKINSKYTLYDFISTSLEEQKRKVREKMNAGMSYLIGTIDKEPIAMTSFRQDFNIKPTYQFNEPYKAGAELYNIYVIKEFQNKDYGKDMLHYTENLITRNNKNLIYTMVWEKNDISKKFLEKAGYSIKGTSPKHFRELGDSLIYGKTFN